MRERLSKVEKDVAEIKRFTTLGVDDDNNMVIEDTPLNYPSDNSPLPPPSSNPPPHPHPSHLPPRTPSPPPGSPPQTDDAKKRENSQERNDKHMVTTKTPYRLEMSESGKDDNQRNRCS